MKRSVVGKIILLAALLFNMPGCNIPGKTTPIPEQSNAAPVLKTLVSQPVVPSDSAQSAVVQDKVKITLPDGTVNSNQNLVISSVTGLPDPSTFRHVLGVFDIELGDQHEFKKNLQIELTYDPKSLDDKRPEAEQLTAGYWDETSQAWMPVEYSVDESRHVIVITTNHLSPYGYMSWLAGYSNVVSEHFSIVYDDKQIRTGPASDYKAVAPHKRTGVPDFISDTLEFLETAYQAYASAGYSLPSGKIDVEVYDYRDSELGSLSGILRVSTISWQAYHDPDKLKHDIGHELFHAVQRTTLGIKNYLLRKWWDEATADYASDAIAWKGTIQEMGKDIRAKYLEDSITATTDFHDYSTSHFIDYLVKHQQIYAFSDLWFQTAGGGNDVLKTLTDKITAPKSLGMQYQDFASFFVFDPASPDKKTTAISKDIANITSPMGPNDKELENAFDVGYFSAKLWAIQNQADRNVLIERKDSSAASVQYAVLGGDTRTSSVNVSPAELETGKTVTLPLKAGDYLYLLVDNHISTSTQNAVLRVSEVSVASGMYTLSIKFDQGCDGTYMNGYNSYSRVNANIPVKIDGTNVTISYDKTTGVKHLVATGSGKIDDKGQMTFKVTLAYTLTESCNGTPCTGTENLEMTFTGVVDSDGYWKGKATGLVTVNYPNTLGNIGDNSASCTAEPIQASLRPGFTDTDL